MPDLEQEIERLRQAGQAMYDAISHMARERPVLDECHYARDVWDDAINGRPLGISLIDPLPQPRSEEAE